MSVGFRAVQDRLVVHRMDEENLSPGGLYLPDLAKERPSQGVVVAIGPGRYIDGELQKTTIAVGDMVLFGKFAGAEVKVGLEDFLILREEDIFLVLTPQEVKAVREVVKAAEAKGQPLAA
jgi:chaperonin GroES